LTSLAGCANPKGNLAHFLHLAGLQAVREVPGSDRRVRLLTLTEKGQSVMAKMQPMVNRAQEKILAPLSKTDRKEFMRMIKVLVSANNDLSRAPSEGV